ncbi:MAG TPA: SMI1/KNR4 family protein [Actinocrinis sp.]|jgi:cell wall assembly regulator SMI1
MGSEESVTGAAVPESGPIRSLWARWEDWLGRHAPQLMPGLASPADAATLAAAQARLGQDLPAALCDLLEIHDGGRQIIGGWDLLNADGIVDAYQLIQLYADEPERAPGWIPFVDSVAGDYLCLDMNPGSGGGAGQVFCYRHDSENGLPMAASLEAWLERIAACLEAGDIVYDAAREDFLPFYGATGFAVAFAADPPLRLDAAHPEAAVAGPRTVSLGTVDSAGPLPGGARIELVEGGTVTALWDLDELRETAECATDYNILILGAAPSGRVAETAALRMSGLTSADTVWIRLVGDQGE